LAKDNHVLIIVLAVAFVAVVGLLSGNGFSSKTIGGKAIEMPAKICSEEEVCAEEITIEKTELDCIEYGLKYYNVCIKYDSSSGKLECSEWTRDSEEECKKWDVIAKEVKICTKHETKKVCK